MDFSHRNTEAQQLINDWVKNRTEGQIQTLLNDAPNPTTKVIIASALHFKGEWNQHFMDGATKRYTNFYLTDCIDDSYFKSSLKLFFRKPFTSDSGEIKFVDMMFNGGSFPYYEDKEAGMKIIGLPYKGHEVSSKRRGFK